VSVGPAATATARTVGKEQQLPADDIGSSDGGGSSSSSIGETVCGSSKTGQKRVQALKRMTTASCCQLLHCPELPHAGTTEPSTLDPG